MEKFYRDPDQQFSSDFDNRLSYSRPIGSYSLGSVCCYSRVAIDFRLIAAQVIFYPDWTIIQLGLLYLNISYPNFKFFEYSLEKDFQTLQLKFVLT